MAFKAQDAVPAERKVAQLSNNNDDEGVQTRVQQGEMYARERAKRRKGQMARCALFLGK